MKQPLPVLRGWLDKVDARTGDGQAARRRSTPASRRPTSKSSTRPASSPRTSTRLPSAGRLTVERLVTVKRPAKLDVRVIAKIGNLKTSVVVPNMAAVTELGPVPRCRASTLPRQARQQAAASSFPVKDPNDEPTCFRAQAGEYFDVKTIQVTASPQGGGILEGKRPEGRGVFGATASAKDGAKDPKGMPYTVILRVDKLRPRTAKD